MMRTRGFVTAVLLVVGLLCAWPVAAQEQSGSIQGIVKDSSGGVLPGVTVEARSPQTVGVSTAVTDEKGAYRFPALPPGTYEVTANLSGFAPAKAAAVNVSLGQLLSVNLTLSVATLTETVQVTAESPLIDVKQNASFATMQKEVIDRIPKGRDFTSVIQTAPGAQAEAKAGGEAQIDGASGSENRFIIDGMDTTNIFSGVSGKTMLVDFIQEVQVKSSGYNAEFGGAMGGVVSALTKSGSNQFRGSAGIYYQSDKFYGDKRQSHSYNPYSDAPEDGLTSFRTPWQYYSPVFDIGGPIVKDKVWFYGGFAYTVNKYNEDAVFTTDPTYTKRQFEQKSTTYYPNYNVTTQLGNNVRLRVSGSNQKDHVRGGLPTISPEGRIYLGTDKNLYGKDMGAGLYTTSTFDKLSNGSVNESAYDRRWNKTGNDGRNDTVSGNLDWVITPKFFVNVTTGYFRTNYTTPEDARGNATMHYLGNANSDSYMTARGYPTVPASFQAASGYSPEISSSGYLRNILDRTYVNANTTWYKSLAGQHVFKAGVRYERIGNDIYNGYAEPRINFYFGNTRDALDGRSVTGKYGYYYVYKQSTSGVVHSNNYAFWLQDSWTVNSKLTINAGVRAQNEHIPSYKKTADAIDLKFGFSDEVAPRLGFAYDLKGDGKWKAYGSFAYYYQAIPLSLPRSAWGGDHWINYYWTLDTYDWTSINCDEGRTGCPGTFIEEWDARRSSNQPDPELAAYFNRPGMTGIDPSLKPIQNGEFTLGMDHELNNTMSLGVRYVHKWLFRTIEDVGIVIPDVGEVYIDSNPGYGYSETMLPSLPQFKTPHATRKYDSIEARLRKRFANRWSAEGSYTYSRLWGNYGGLASSDEDGRLDPNVNRYFDNIVMSYDMNHQQVFGLLPTDRPHVVKLQATYDLPWGMSLGGFYIIESGLPQSSQFTYLGYPIYYNDRGDLGRLPVYSNLDLNIQQEFRLGGSKRVVLSANVTNLFDQKIVTGFYSTNPYRSGVNFSEETFFTTNWTPASLVAQARATGSTIKDEAWYKTPNAYQGARQMRIQAKFSF